jgi:putative hydrolase of the HAD superfamily
MSQLAEFAEKVHESSKREENRQLSAVNYSAKSDRCTNIRAVICDVYGTLVDYWRDDFIDPHNKQDTLLKAFLAAAEQFSMTVSIKNTNPSDPPEKTLNDFYHGLIALRHEQAKKRGVAFPEIQIEEIWELIITILKRHGYSPELDRGESIRDFSRKVAWFYNFQALGRKLYPGVTAALEALRNKNMVIGLLSNAQFYTPIDLTLFIRDQSAGKYEDIFELFDVDLTFFSYEYRIAKPHNLLFRKLFDALYEFQILPEQTIFIGNDLAIDIAPAAEVGMKTALFTGDSKSTFIHDRAGNVIPDITFTSWTDLPDLLYFHNGGN